MSGLNELMGFLQTDVGKLKENATRAKNEFATVDEFDLNAT